MSGCSVNNTLNMQGGGIKKKNGHKDNCECPICVNIKHAKGGAGYDVDNTETSTVTQTAGKKKSNGHKANCGCPICRNMKKSGNKNITMKDGKKKSNGHKANCGCPICQNMKNKKGGANDDEDTTSSGDSTDSNTTSTSDSNTTSTSDSIDEEQTTSSHMLGGKTKKNGKKSNGHKSNCKCPICQNMKRGKQTHRKNKSHKKRSYRRH